MFSKPVNITVSPPIKICNLNVNRFFNTNNLSSLHKQALAIQPEWLNGFNVSFNKLIAIDTAVGVSETDVDNGHLVKRNYSLNNNNDGNVDPLKQPHCIRMTLNPYGKSSKLFICVHPSSTFRIKFKNQIFASKIFNEIINHGNFNSLSSINIKNECEGDWFGRTSRASLSIFASNAESITSNFSIVKKIAPNFAIETGFHCNRAAPKYLLLEPWLATAYSNANINLAASMWLKSLKVDLSCFKRINDHMQVGSMFSIDARARNAIGQLFCQYELRDSIIRAKVTSNGLIGATHEFKFWNFNLINSVITNAVTKKIIYGIQIEMEV